MWCWEWEYNIPAQAWFVCLGSVGCLNQVFVKQGLSDFSGRVPHLWSMSKIPLGGKSLISVLVKYWPMASPSQESSKGGQHRKTWQPRRSLNMEGVEEQLSHFPPPLEVLAAVRKVLRALPASRHCCVHYHPRKTVPCFYGQASCCQCELSSVVPAEPVRSPAAFPVSLLAFLGAVEGM